MITTCTTSTESQFSTLANLLTVLGATASSSGMDLALSDATAWVERYVTNSASGTLRRQVYRETLAGYGTQRLRLTRTPVLGIQRMFNATDTGTATEYCSTSYRLENKEAGFLEVTSDAGFAWDAIQDWNLASYPRPSAVRRPWLVVYEAGYQYACTSSTANTWVTTTTGRTLPEDIERAVLLKAAEFYQGSVSGISRMQVGPLSLNYASEATDPVVQLLSPYVKVR